MHFCAFGLLPKFNTRYNVNLMFAKSLFSEICTQKAHLPSWGRPGEHIRRAGRHCGQGAPVCTPLPKSKGFESRTKVKTLPKSKWCPLPKSRMILREKTSGKVELGLYYALLFHDSGIHPVILTILHGYLFQEVVLEGGIIIRVDVSFLVMTANRSRYSLIYFPLFLGLIPILFWLKPSF